MSTKIFNLHVNNFSASGGFCMSHNSTDLKWLWHERETYFGLQGWQVASWWTLELKAVQQTCQDQEELDSGQRLA